MRTIKFRVWSEKHKRFIGSTPAIKLIGSQYTELVGSDNEVIEQFTGLTDKKGKEIYEGDVVKKVDFIDRSETKYVVLFYRGAFRLFEVHFALKIEPYESYEYGIDYGQWRGFSKRSSQLRQNPKSFMVIGNIHDNTELLESK